MKWTVFTSLRSLVLQLTTGTLHRKTEKQTETDRHRQSETLGRWFDGSNLSGHFGTKAEESKQFGPKC